MSTQYTDRPTVWKGKKLPTDGELVEECGLVVGGGGAIFVHAADDVELAGGIETDGLFPSPFLRGVGFSGEDSPFPQPVDLDLLQAGPTGRRGKSQPFITVGRDMAVQGPGDFFTPESPRLRRHWPSAATDLILLNSRPPTPR